IGSDGLIMLDHWQGNRTPYRDPLAKGAIVGLTLSHNKYHIYRAILESIALGTNNVINKMRSLNIPVNKIIVGGGLTKNHLLMQMISDCTNKLMYVPDTTETSVKGAAIVASYGEGYYQSLQEASEKMTALSLAFSPKSQNKRRYEKLFHKYIRLNEILNPFVNNSGKKWGNIENASIT